MIVVSGIALLAFLYEARTSALQSWILSSYAQKMSYRVEPGPSPRILFPRHGPFDVRAGYTRIPEFEKRLRKAGYEVTEQVRFSPELQRVARWGIFPYSEPVFSKLTITGMDGHPLFEAPVGGHFFRAFEEVPEPVVKALLVIENRELEDPADSRTNPVVDWDRLFKAALLYTGNKLGLPLSVEGGSTLATQMEKYRHSYEGRTNSLLAKLRQMTDASLKVYRKGPDTRETRREIILDYLNSIPLAAAPGYGEIHGIGNGLKAWFGLELKEVQAALSLPDDHPDKARAFKHVLALLCSVRAPSQYLVNDREALQRRTNFYTRLMANLQVISPRFAQAVESEQMAFASRRPKNTLPSFSERKATNELRSRLMTLLGVSGLYELDRIHLDVKSTINPDLQQTVVNLFQKLHDPQFIDAAGLRGERLLASGDPSKVVYGMILFEKTPQGNLLRVVTDTLNAPFDINTGMKMQLGSTAKLRTLANYLSIVASLYDELSPLDAESLKERAGSARDPITRWAAETLVSTPRPDLDALLQLALDRKYSASPGEAFFTGGGLHTFGNFNKNDNGRIVTVRQATEHSINLPYIRLMRDLVRYYEARLPYDTTAVLSDINHPVRLKMLHEIADEESKIFLSRAYRSFKDRSQKEIIAELLGNKAASDRHLAILFYAWHRGADESGLHSWLQDHLGDVTPAQVARLAKAYGNPRLNLADYGYLLGIHPLNVWCAAEMAKDPSIEWSRLWEASIEARQVSSSWLFKTRNRKAQDLRLRIRIEQDAFLRMTPHWKRLGFPFDRLVPSLATAIGSSGDRPESLAQLVGIFLNDGMLRPVIRMAELRFAAGTPYETAMAPADTPGKRVMPQAVARAILPVLAKVVEGGTAIRLAGAYKVGDKKLVVGGKTGSGDNRFNAVGRGGGVIASRAVDRTAAFVFYIGDRYFGVITVFVPGAESEGYGFTSSLPVAILKLLAPEIEKLWEEPDKKDSRGNMMLVSSSPLGAAAKPAPAKPIKATAR
ncbi:MAG: glycosyl transferase family 51 [Acidobacteria bacterium]|nr:glycosyl transferase family 51 [Acidobacteriota bacterium]